VTRLRHLGWAVGTPMRVPGSPAASTGKSLRDSRIDRAALLAVQGSRPLSHLPWSGGQLPAASHAGKAYLSGNGSLLAQLGMFTPEG